MDDFLGGGSRSSIKPGKESSTRIIIAKKRTAEYCKFNDEIRRRKKSSEIDCFMCNYAAGDTARGSKDNVNTSLCIDPGLFF